MQSQTSASHAAVITNKHQLNENAGHGDQAGLTYWLPPHVFVCQTRDCVVFMDARRDKYLGIGGSGAEALRTVLLANSSKKSSDGTILPISSQVTQALDALVARGLLTRESSSGRQFRQVHVPLGSSAIGPGAEYEHVPRLTHILAALIACIGARIDLRFRGVDSTVARLMAEEQKHRRRSSTVNAGELRRLVGIFRVIRPFVYAKKNQCLFHGLALYRFLRHYGHSPTWVIGVSTAPFAAHCWVQYGECVLDDSPKQTLEFTPVAAS